MCNTARRIRKLLRVSAPAGGDVSAPPLVLEFSEETVAVVTRTSASEAERVSKSSNFLSLWLLIKRKKCHFTY